MKRKWAIITHQYEGNPAFILRLLSLLLLQYIMSSDSHLLNSNFAKSCSAIIYFSIGRQFGDLERGIEIANAMGVMDERHFVRFAHNMILEDISYALDQFWHECWVGKILNMSLLLQNQICLFLVSIF